MYYLCYQSECTFSLTHQNIIQILEKSRINNASNNLTGILLIINNTFLQILEGSQSQVEKTFQRITLDKRHENIVKLMDGHIQERSFPLWTMGYKLMGAEEVNEIDKYLDISTRTIRDIGDTSNNKDLFISFLRSYY